MTLSVVRAAMLLVSIAAFAAPARAGDKADIAVADVWARASVMATSAAYMTIENTGARDDALVAVRGDVAKKVEIHDMIMDDMVMRMRRVERLEIPAGARVELAPGGLHIMLIRLQGPLAEGDSVPLTLVFEKAGEIAVAATVQQAGHGGHGGHQAH